jgi:hypothetical protein
MGRVCDVSTDVYAVIAIGERIGHEQYSIKFGINGAMFHFFFFFFIEKFNGWTLRPQDIIAVHHTITKYIR